MAIAAFPRAGTRDSGNLNRLPDLRRDHTGFAPIVIDQPGLDYYFDVPPFPSGGCRGGPPFQVFGIRYELQRSRRPLLAQASDHHHHLPTFRFRRTGDQGVILGDTWSHGCRPIPAVWVLPIE